MSSINEADQNDEPSNSSSSCSTITLTATTSTGSSSSLASSVSDTDDNLGSSPAQLHRQCHKSNSHSESTPRQSNEAPPPGGRLEMIDRLELTKGQNCDTSIGASCQRAAACGASSGNNEYARQHREDEVSSMPISKASLQINPVPSSSLGKSASDRFSHVPELCPRHERQEKVKPTTGVGLGSSYSNLSSTTSNSTPVTSKEVPTRRTLKPAPSPSPSLSTIDTNNNKNPNSSSVDGLTSRRTNFSKSASGSRLITKSRSNVCDCLSQDCSEKRHSNRRRFIEHYYNSRTQLPSSDTSSSSFNISTPLNKLSECDAITRRLLSSPIRTTTLVESPTQIAQMSDVDRARRASLGTSTMTDQVFLYSSDAFSSIESNSKKSQDEAAENPRRRDDQSARTTSGDYDIKLKQQQGRSFSVCHDDTLSSRIKNISSNHSANFNRAVSLACESGSSPNARRLLTIIPLFGCDIKSLEQFTKMECVFPPVINSAVNHILDKGIDSIGIFRKSGVKSRILSLRQRIEANQDMKFDELNQNNEFSIYDIADLVKMWFRELKPVPLMRKELIKLISSFLKSSSTNTPPSLPMKRGNSSHQDSFPASGQSDLSSRLFDISLKNRIDSVTTSSHRALLFRALSFLAQISKRCEANQMTSQNLAICLTPSLCETESDQNSILIDQKVLEYCIDNHLILFGRRPRH